jgi:hypothetical protein
MSEPAPTATPPRRRRRWFSLSLRTLMILVLVVGGFMGWKARRASLQRRAVARIQYLRGSVTYDWGFNSPVTSEPHGPAWLRKILGDEYFQEVVAVTLPVRARGTPPIMPSLDPDGSKVREIAEENRLDIEAEKALRNDDLACLEGLDQIEFLTLGIGTVLKSDGLARLGRLSCLKFLTIAEPLTDEGVAQISGLTELKSLYASFKLSDPSALALVERLPRLETLVINEGINPSDGGVETTIAPDKINDAWLARLGRLHQLKILNLVGSGITDAGLAHLKGLERLEGLSVGQKFGDTESFLITDAGFANLAGLKSLKGLYFSSASQITDAGLTYLGGLKQLTDLELPQITKMTDAGLTHLVGLENLKRLNLKSASKVTEAGVSQLAKLPQLSRLVFNPHSLSDAGLVRFQSMTNLNLLTLSGRKIERKILDQIEAASSGLIIITDPKDDELTPDAGTQSTSPAGIAPPGTP